MRVTPIIEGFAVETGEHLIFSVKGLLHPKDRVTAYLRYLPDPDGDRIREGVAFRRVYHFEEQSDILRTRYPHYLSHDPVLGIQVQSVPRSSIRAVYDPRARLKRLHRIGVADPVERDALDLADQLRRASGVHWESLGISGSVMLSMHRPDSDLDLVIYGQGSGRAVYAALAELLDRSEGPVRRLDDEGLKHLHAEHRPDTPLSFTDFCRLQRRKVNEGRFRQRPFFVRFVKHPDEVQERYGERQYRYVGQATLRATVIDDRDAIFTPCYYRVAGTVVLDGPAVDDLRELVSFRGRFTDQVRIGETAKARGSVEQVVPESGPAYQRLVIGGRAGDYLLATE
jgi:predicted nucleotidyltransferase